VGCETRVIHLKLNERITNSGRPHTINHSFLIS
jgi:hypothetical protein